MKKGYASSTQPVGATGPKQIRVMSLNNHFSTVSVTNARSSSLFQNFSPSQVLRLLRHQSTPGPRPRSGVDSMAHNERRQRSEWVDRARGMSITQHSPRVDRAHAGYRLSLDRCRTQESATNSVCRGSSRGCVHQWTDARKIPQKLPLRATFRHPRRGPRAAGLARQAVAASGDRTRAVRGRAIPKPSGMRSPRKTATSISPMFTIRIGGQPILAPLKSHDRQAIDRGSPGGNVRNVHAVTPHHAS
jgi:hypothetical protein